MTCSMASLVEADHDDRLDAREKATVARHLLVCTECRDHAADLRDLRALATPERRSVSSMDHHRGRVRLLQDAASPEAGSSRHSRPMLRDLSETASLRRSGRAAPSRRAIGFASMSAVVLFVTLTFGLLRAESPRLALPSDGVYAALKLNVVAAGPNTSFKRSQSGGLDLVELSSGTVHVRAHHMVSGERFLIRTADAEVEVRGTHFDVEAKAGAIVRVKVTEGTVELRRNGESKLLPAGTEWGAPVVARTDAPIVPDLGEAPSAQPSALATGPSRSISGHSTSSGATPSDKHHERPSESSSGSLYEDASGAPTVDDAAAFRSGMARLERGDFGQAATDLKSFATTHPDDPRAEDAAFLEALSLSRAGRAVDASRAAHLYLAKYPNGYRRAEAEKLLQKLD